MARNDWTAIRTALEEVSARCADLLRDTQDGTVRAVGEWSVGEVGAHLVEVSVLDTAFATGAPPPPEWTDVYAEAATASIDTVNDLNALALSVVRERSPRALASRVEDQVGRLLSETSTADGSEQVAWLGGTKVPLEAVLAHMLSELFVHGNDVARATRRSFPLPASQASLIFTGFLTALLRSPDAATFGGERSSHIRPVGVEFRLRGGPRLTLVSTEEGVRVEDPGEASADVLVTADPGALWLVMTGRTNPLRAALSRRVIVWGRRPWRLRRLMEAVRAP